MNIACADLETLITRVGTGPEFETRPIFNENTNFLTKSKLKFKCNFFLSQNLLSPLAAADLAVQFG